MALVREDDEQAGNGCHHRREDPGEAIRPGWHHGVPDAGAEPTGDCLAGAIESRRVDAEGEEQDRAEMHQLHERREHQFTHVHGRLPGQRGAGEDERGPEHEQAPPAHMAKDRAGLGRRRDPDADGQDLDGEEERRHGRDAQQFPRHDVVLVPDAGARPDQAERARLSDGEQGGPEKRHAPRAK